MEKTRVWILFSGLFVTGTAPWVDLGVRVGGLLIEESYFVKSISLGPHGPEKGEATS